MFCLVPVEENTIFHTVELNWFICKSPVEGKNNLPPVALEFPGITTGEGQSFVRTVTFALTIPEVLSTTGKAPKEKVNLPVPASKMTKPLSTALTLKEYVPFAADGKANS